MSIAIRQLGCEDAELYRAVRLETLTKSPGAFGDALEDARARPLEAFSAIPGSATIFLAESRGEAAGTANSDALSLYRRHGFSISGPEPRALCHEGRHIDEHTMVMMLDGGSGAEPSGRGPSAT